MQKSRIAKMFAKASSDTVKGKGKLNGHTGYEQLDTAFESVEVYMAWMEAQLHDSTTHASKTTVINDLLRNKTPNEASVRLASDILTADMNILRERDIVLQGPVPLRDWASMTVVQLAREAMSLTNEGAEVQSDAATVSPDTRRGRGVVVLYLDDQLMVVAIETTAQESVQCSANSRQLPAEAIAYVPRSDSNLRTTEWMQALLTVIARSKAAVWMAGAQTLTALEVFSNRAVRWIW
jgi:hypothetical protein